MSRQGDSCSLSSKPSPFLSATPSASRAPMNALTKSSSTPPVPNGAESRAQVLWFGGENANQDVRIRLVHNVDDDYTSVCMMVHSSYLEKCSSYFEAVLSLRWRSKPKENPAEFTFHVDGEVVQLYTECVSRMYNPLEVGFKSVRCSLELLAVATHLGYDDLMSSICLYLASVCPWTDAEEISIRKAVSSEDFPRGHARDLLERLERRLTRDDLRSLVTRCMKSLQSDRPREAGDLLLHLLETARVQERGPIPIFEQDMVAIIKETIKLLIVQANDEIEVVNSMRGYPDEGENTKARDRGILSKLERIHQVINYMLQTEMADESVAWLVQYSSIPNFVKDKVFSDDMDIVDTVIVVDRFVWTIVTIFKELVAGNLRLGALHRDALVEDWLPLLDWLHKHSAEALGGMAVGYVVEYGQLRETFLRDPPCSRRIVDGILMTPSLTALGLFVLENDDY